MVGFVQNLNAQGSLTEHPVTCFFAEKDKSNLYENQVGPTSSALVAQDDEYHLLQTSEAINQKNETLKPKDRNKARAKLPNSFVNHKPSDQMDAYINYVNDNQHMFTWRANECMLQKSNKNFNKSQCEEHGSNPHQGISLAQKDIHKL